ncbi:MAG: TIGR04282 family arsenosugar biosynthesis glycosyltransferase [Armatimonadota bacterium]
MRRTLIITAGANIFDNNISELSPPLEQADIEKLQESFLLDTIEKAAVVPDTELVISCESSISEIAVQDILPDRVSLIANPDNDKKELLSVCLSRLCEPDQAIVFIGSDCPTLPVRCLELAFDALANNEVEIVLGPAEDGGCYLLGIESSHIDLLRNISQDEPRCIEKWIELAAENNLGWYQLPVWHRVRTASDLVCLKNELMEKWAKNGSSKHTKEFITTLVAHGKL